LFFTLRALATLNLEVEGFAADLLIGVPGLLALFTICFDWLPGTPVTPRYSNLLKFLMRKIISVSTNIAKASSNNAVARKPWSNQQAFLTVSPRANIFQGLTIKLIVYFNIISSK
jgi:hypothetical protein